ncbi:MAG: efflux RND transporter periplasmic adaptor subunit [Gemmataceae bacterium]
MQQALAPSVEGSTSAGIAVKTASPKKQTLHWTVEQPATVAAYESTPVAAMIAGYVKAIATDKQGKPIDIGSVVERGQPLATLDVPHLEAEAEQKKAGVAQAVAEHEQVKKDVAVADAQVTAAKAMLKEADAGIAKATAEYDRWKAELAQADDLVSRKVIDTQSRAVVFKQFQSAEAGQAEAAARVNTAKATLAEREAKRAKVDADVLAAAAKVKVAEAAAKEVQARVGYTVIPAPFDGIVTARNVHTRHFVQPPAGGTGQPLFVVARLDIVRIFTDVPEASAAKAVAGAKAMVRIPALGNAELPAAITRTAGVVDPATRMLRAEIDLANEKRMLQPGLYAFVRIEAEAADAVLLPAACILAADETNYAYLVEDSKAVKYRVQVGRSEGTAMQVLGRRKATATGGEWIPFTGTERVVQGNLGALADGVEVKE